jgi:lysophospholipase L1-like esterase
MARIFVDGGSGAYGYHDHNGGGWAGQLKGAMTMRAEAGKPTADVINLAVPTKTVVHIARELPAAMDRYRERGRTVIMFMICGTDSQISQGKNEPIVPLPDFRDTLGQINKVCTERNAKQIFLSYPPIDDARTRPFPLTGNDCSSERITAYNSEVSEHAGRIGAAFLDIHALLGKYDRDSVLAADGLHPTPTGHTIIYEEAMALATNILGYQ